MHHPLRISRPLLIAAASVLSLSLAPLARATLLSHDSVEGGGEAAVQQGMCLGECATSVFTVEEDFDLKYIYLIAGPSGYSAFFDMFVVGLSGDTPDLAQELSYNAFAFSIDAAGWAELDFGYNGMAPVPFLAGESFAVAVCPNTEEYDSCGSWGFAVDADGIDAPDDNWVYAMIDGVCNPSSPSTSCQGSNWLWAKTSMFGVAGDWAIRAADTPWDGEIPSDDDTPSDDDDATADDDDDDATSDDDDTTPEALDLDSLVPSSTEEGSPVQFTVTGAGFVAGTELFLGGLRVSDLQVSSDNAMSGTTPSALPVGIHDLSVSRPDGGTDSLPRAFEVTALETGCDCDATGGGSEGRASLLGMLALLLAGKARRGKR